MIKKLLFATLIISSLYSNAQQIYYDDVDLTKTGVALKNELATKITNTHTNFLTYTPDVWTACKATDVNPNDSSEILLIYGYTNDSSDTALTEDINDQNSGGSNGWNREHTYPKSLGNPNLGTSGPGSDAHHLRPSDVQYNSLRGSKPFAAGSGNSGDVTDGWYPGDEWKGDVARMMMYMYLRYGTQCLPSTVGVGNKSATPDEMIDLFLTWNAEDPVSVIEDTRNTYHENTSNEAAQGNRNPFIDNPNLATQIWGGTVAENRWATASINDINTLNTLKTYPNPSTTGKTTILYSYNSNTKIENISVYSVIGKKVNEIKNPNFINNKYTIENLKSGIYLLKISTKKESTTKKLIVQ